MSVFIIADPGAAHCMDLGIAKELTVAVADAGADAVKWQVYRADSLYVPGEYHDIAQRYEMPLDWLPILARAAADHGLEFMASAFSKELYDAVDPYVKRHKIASLESSDPELVAYVESKGKPMIISTGASDFNSVFAFSSDATILHCITAYPAPLRDANMRAMRTIGRIRETGLSDHSTDPKLLPVMAVAMGASVIEKHVRLETTPIDNPDYQHSLTPTQFAEMVQAVRMAESAMGDGVKRPMPSEAALIPWKRKPGKLRGAA